MINPILGIDVWSGQGETDEATLKTNGVAFMFIRLNDMNGGHHKDSNFDKQWAEAKNMYRAPYFVYNPWVSGLANFQWLDANMPADAKAVALDAEVTMSGYSPTLYAQEFSKFEALVKGKWNYVIYTGEWFLSYLSAWNKNADYWWAQYPFEFYPATTTALTWDGLRSKLLFYAGPANASKIPGHLKFWQLSGDRLILPGNTRVIDIDVFFGTETELAAFFNGTSTAPVPDVTTHPYDGMTRINGKRNGYWFELFKLDHAKFEFELVSTPNLETVPSVSKRKGALLATNAGEWNDKYPLLPTYLKPESYTVSNGKLIQYRLEITPSLMVTDFNQIIIDHKAQTANIEQAFSGLRYIVGSQVDSSGWSTEGHARACFGLDAAGNVMILLSEGTYPNQGLKLTEGKQILEQYGAVVAFDGGGGGDVGGVLNGTNLIVPENIVNGQNVYRALPMTFCVYRKDVNMATRYEATAIGDNTKLRPNHNTLTDFNPVQSFPAGAKFYGDMLWVADATNKDASQYVGDKWLQLDATHWVAIIHRGVAICTLKDNGAPPPVVEYLESETIEPASGTVITKLYNTGRTERIVIP